MTCAKLFYPFLLNIIIRSWMELSQVSLGFQKAPSLVLVRSKVFFELEPHPNPTQTDCT